MDMGRWVQVQQLALSALIDTHIDIRFIIHALNPGVVYVRIMIIYADLNIVLIG